MGMSNYVLDQEDKKFAEWMAKVDAICMDKLFTPAECLPDHNWAELCADGYTPAEAFNAYFEDQYGETWEEINGQFGVGA